MQIISVVLNEKTVDENLDQGWITANFDGSHWKVQASQGWLVLEERKRTGGGHPDRLLIPDHRVREVNVTTQVEQFSDPSPDDEWVNQSGFEELVEQDDGTWVVVAESEHASITEADVADA